MPSASASKSASTSGRKRARKALRAESRSKKLCPQCRRFLRPKRFYRDRSRPDGRDVYCKECRDGFTRAHRHNERLDEIREIARRFAEIRRRENVRRRSRQRHPETKECAVENCRRPGRRHHFGFSDPDEILWLCDHHHLVILHGLEAKLDKVSRALGIE